MLCIAKPQESPTLAVVSDDDKKYPYRNLGERAQLRTAADASAHEPASAQTPKSGVQQSVFQTAVDTSISAVVNPEMAAQAVAAQAAQAELYQRLCKQQRRRKIAVLFLLGIGSLLLAIPSTQSLLFPLVAASLGVCSGWCLGKFYMDDFWARLLHTIPQIIWGLIAMHYGWQNGGMYLIFISGAWLLHFGLATVAALYLRQEDRIE